MSMTGRVAVAQESDSGPTRRALSCARAIPRKIPESQRRIAPPNDLRTRPGMVPYGARPISHGLSLVGARGLNSDHGPEPSALPARYAPRRKPVIPNRRILQSFRESPHPAMETFRCRNRYTTIARLTTINTNVRGENRCRSSRLRPGPTPRSERSSPRGPGVPEEETSPRARPAMTQAATNAE